MEQVPPADVLPEIAKEVVMPRGDKSSYTDKQKRQAEHIEEGYERRGVPEGEAERRAWATVNKETHGGKKSGSGRGKPEDHAPSRKGGKLGGKASERAGHHLNVLDQRRRRQKHGSVAQPNGAVRGPP